MSIRTLREAVTEAVAELQGELSFALFTTFNFDPIFFEDYVLPLLDEGLDASSVSGIRTGNEFLKHTPVVVFYDAGQLCQGRMRLSYGTVPVNKDGCHFFHPKLILLASKTGDLRLLVGSANLTVSGWGRNEEVVGITGVPAKSDLSRSLHRLLLRLMETARAALPGVHRSSSAWYKQLNDIANAVATKRARHESTYKLLWELPGDGTPQVPIMEQLRPLIPDVPTTITIYSPYFASDLSGLVERLVGHRSDITVEVVPALTRDGTGVVRAGIAQKELLKENRKYRLRQLVGGDFARLRHAKIFWIRPERRRHVLVVGSANFTTAALGVPAVAGSPVNAEAGLALGCSESDALDLLGPLASLKPLKPSDVVGMSEEDYRDEVPKPAPFLCSVLADWERREYRIVLKARGAAGLDLPGLAINRLEPTRTPHVVPFSREAESALCRRKYFRAWLLDDERHAIRGLVCEVAWEKFRVEGRGERLEDYFDVWRALTDEQRKARSIRRTVKLLGGNAPGDGEGDSMEELSARVERCDYLNNLYWMMGAFVEIDRHLSDEACDVCDIVYTSPHSLMNFVQTVEELPQEQFSPVLRWVFYTEALHLLRKHSRQIRRASPSLDARVAFKIEQLQGLCLGVEQTTDFSDRFGSLSRSSLFEWFREQLGVVFDSAKSGRKDGGPP